MTITPHIFGAYLKCPMKCWLRATNVRPTGNAYAEWLQTETELYHFAEAKRLLTSMPFLYSAFFLSSQLPEYLSQMLPQLFVQHLSPALWNELPDEQTHAIHLAGTVHDLGKINTPAEILSKPGRITDIEYSLIKIHPQSGYDILKGIDFPWPIAQMVLQHHERMDGSGYPQGLKGDDILFEARILSVADVVEAMYSHRPYRPGLGLEVALGEITRQRGTQFDPKVVDACLAVFREQHYSFKS